MKYLLFLLFPILATAQVITVSPTGLPVTISPTGLSITVSVGVTPPVVDPSAYYLNLQPDFERRTGSLSGNQLHINGRTGVMSDIGKSVTIKGGRYFPEFRKATIAWWGTVTGINAGNLIVSGGTYGTPDSQLHDTVGCEVMLFTNYYDSIRLAIDNATVSVKNGLNTKHVVLNWNSSTYVAINPFITTSFNTQSYIYNDLRAMFRPAGCDSLILEGIDSARTKIKLASEDVAVVGNDNFGGYVFMPTTSFANQNYTLEMPDRTSTMNLSNIGFVKPYGANRSVFLRSVQWTSPSVWHNADQGISDDEQFGTPAVGANGHEDIFYVYHSKIQAANAVSMYSQQGPVKSAVMQNVRLETGGKKSWNVWQSAAQITYANDTPKITVSNAEFSFKQDRLSEWPDRQPILLLYPNAEDTIILIHHCPGDQTDPYGNGEIYFSDNNVNLHDGLEHYVYFKWQNNIDPANKACVYQSDANLYRTNVYYNLNGTKTQVFFPNGGDGRYGDILRMMDTSLIKVSVRIKYENNAMSIYEGYAVMTRENTTNTASIYEVNLDENKQPIYGDFANNVRVLARMNGGSVVVQGRGKSPGYGHGFYDHINVRLNLDSLYFNQDGRSAQYQSYMIRTSVGSCNVIGPNNYIKITHYYANGGIYPFSYSYRYILPLVELQNSGYGPNCASPIFTGTAIIGQTVTDYDAAREHLQVAYSIIDDR